MSILLQTSHTLHTLLLPDDTDWTTSETFYIYLNIIYLF